MQFFFPFLFGLQMEVFPQFHFVAAIFFFFFYVRFRGERKEMIAKHGTSCPRVIECIYVQHPCTLRYEPCGYMNFSRRDGAVIRVWLVFRFSSFRNCCSNVLQHTFSMNNRNDLYKIVCTSCSHNGMVYVLIVMSPTHL